MRLVDRLLRRPTVPGWLAGSLAADEYVLASATLAHGVLVATSHGLALPEQRTVGWHLVSKATWAGGVLTVAALPRLRSS